MKALKRCLSYLFDTLKVLVFKRAIFMVSLNLTFSKEKETTTAKVLGKDKK